MQWFSSTAARVAQLEEPRSAEQEVVSSSTKVFKKSGDIMLAVKPLFSVQMIASLGRDIKALALVSFILVLQLEGDVKEPVTLFKKK